MGKPSGGGGNSAADAAQAAFLGQQGELVREIWDTAGKPEMQRQQVARASMDPVRSRMMSNLAGKPVTFNTPQSQTAPSFASMKAAINQTNPVSGVKQEWNDEGGLRFSLGNNQWWQQHGQGLQRLAAQNPQLGAYLQTLPEYKNRVGTTTATASPDTPTIGMGMPALNTQSGGNWFGENSAMDILGRTAAAPNLTNYQSDFSGAPPAAIDPNNYRTKALTVDVAGRPVASIDPNRYQTHTFTNLNRLNEFSGPGNWFDAGQAYDQASRVQDSVLSSRAALGNATNAAGNLALRGAGGSSLAGTTQQALKNMTATENAARAGERFKERLAIEGALRGEANQLAQNRLQNFQGITSAENARIMADAGLARTAAQDSSADWFNAENLRLQTDSADNARILQDAGLAQGAIAANNQNWFAQEAMRQQQADIANQNAMTAAQWQAANDAQQRKDLWDQLSWIAADSGMQLNPYQAVSGFGDVASGYGQMAQAQAARAAQQQQANAAAYGGLGSFFGAALGNPYLWK